MLSTSSWIKNDPAYIYRLCTCHPKGINCGRILSLKIGPNASLWQTEIIYVNLNASGRFTSTFVWTYIMTTRNPFSSCKLVSICLWKTSLTQANIIPDLFPWNLKRMGLKYITKIGNETFWIDLKSQSGIRSGSVRSKKKMLSKLIYAEKQAKLLFL